MKARVKATGEVFEIAPYATITIECCDSFEEPLRFCFDEVEILSEGNDLKESEVPDYWTRLEHQAAIAAMQQLVTLVNVGYEYVYEETAIIALNFAHALVEMMKEERK